MNISELVKARSKALHGSTSYTCKDKLEQSIKRDEYHDLAVSLEHQLACAIVEKIGEVPEYPTYLPNGKMLQSVNGNTALYVDANNWSQERWVYNPVIQYNRVINDLRKGL